MNEAGTVLQPKRVTTNPSIRVYPANDEIHDPLSDLDATYDIEIARSSYELYGVLDDVEHVVFVSTGESVEQWLARTGQQNGNNA